MCFFRSFHSPFLVSAWCALLSWCFGIWRVHKNAFAHLSQSFDLIPHTYWRYIHTHTRECCRLWINKIVHSVFDKNCSKFYNSFAEEATEQKKTTHEKINIAHIYLYKTKTSRNEKPRTIAHETNQTERKRKWREKEKKRHQPHGGSGCVCCNFNFISNFSSRLHSKGWGWIGEQFLKNWHSLIYWEKERALTLSISLWQYWEANRMWVCNKRNSCNFNENWKTPRAINYHLFVSWVIQMKIQNFSTGAPSFRGELEAPSFQGATFRLLLCDREKGKKRRTWEKRIR